MKANSKCESYTTSNAFSEESFDSDEINMVRMEHLVQNLPIASVVPLLLDKFDALVVVAGVVQEALLAEQ